MGVRRKVNSSMSDKLIGWAKDYKLRVKMFSGFLKKRENLLLGTVITVCILAVISLIMEDLENLDVASHFTHGVGILALVYKLTVKKSCAGLSLKAQELTAISVIAKIAYGLTSGGGDVFTLISVVKLVATLWVIYKMRFDLRSTYTKNFDNMPLHYMVVPCAIVAVFINPRAAHSWSVMRIVYSFEMCLDAVSMLPQLLLMQKNKEVENFTAHYVCALGISKIFGFAYWIVLIYHSGGRYLIDGATGRSLWVTLMLLAEAVKGFILGDFCYWYLKSAIAGERIMKLPL